MTALMLVARSRGNAKQRLLCNFSLCHTFDLVEENETACSQYPWFESVAAAQQRKVLRTPM